MPKLAREHIILRRPTIGARIPTSPRSSVGIWRRSAAQLLSGPLAENFSTLPVQYIHWLASWLITTLEGVQVVVGITRRLVV